ncbi:TonB-dependent receptor [Luteimonas sp. SJ-92]|uniref:TonB-dependent receptor n=1 Tax=Luteimonas salinisoli TaxID=2752307 RepID=A0A853JDJ5_9GAMM|nr:TonB-dependent receptor [Luteimonas salinisoli]NZA26814.1 TonB-dependent receptor [Luteimonas salinisoli]
MSPLRRRVTSHRSLLSAAYLLGLALPPLAFAQAPPSSVTDLDAVQVIGRAQTLYKVEDSTTATRTATPLEWVPQSVQVLPRELIDDQAARQVTDLYRSISGISFFSYAGVTLRGFRQENVLYDGLRGDPYAGFSVPQLFDIERVEVLKGPAGALYGGGDPGGVINYITRKPQRDPQTSVELQLGNDDFAAASFQSTGPLAGNDRLRYRIGVHGEREEPFRWNTDNELRMGDAAVALDVGATGELTLKLTDITQEQAGNRLRGVPVDDNGAFLTDRRWNHNEATDFLDMDARIALATYTASPTPALDVDVSARWFENQEHQQYHEPWGLIDRDGDGTAEWMTRQFRDQARDVEGLAANANGVWRARAGGVGHTLLFGVDGYREDSDFMGRTAHSDAAGGGVPGVDLFAPVYGLTSGADYTFDPWRVTRSRGTRYGAYLQDQVELTPRWQLLAGLRWDGFEDEDRVGGATVDGHDISWRVGSTYALAEGVNAYANVASGFVPQSTGNQRAEVGGPFDPERGRQWEVGLKTALAGGRVTLNSALYRIERSNVLQATGEVVDGVNQIAPLGLVRSEGLELDLLADVTSRWVVSAAYAYNDTRVIDAGTNGITNSVGDEFANAPQNTFGLWTRYELPALRSSVGFGADYVDERLSIGGQRVKPYTIYDLSWQTHWDGWHFQANIKNLFDKVYAASGFIERTGHFPGEPRRLYLQARYAF